MGIRRPGDVSCIQWHSNRRRRPWQRSTLPEKIARSGLCGRHSACTADVRPYFSKRSFRFQINLMINRSADHLRSYAKGRTSGAPAWMLQRITGLALVILTVGHYIMMHYTPASGHDYDWTAARLASPLFKGSYLGFITIGMYHGLQGCWNIVRD